MDKNEKKTIEMEKRCHYEICSCPFLVGSLQKQMWYEYELVEWYAILLLTNGINNSDGVDEIDDHSDSFFFNDIMTIRNDQQ